MFTFVFKRIGGFCLLVVGISDLWLHLIHQCSFPGLIRLVSFYVCDSTNVLSQSQGACVFMSMYCYVVLWWCCYCCRCRCCCECLWCTQGHITSGGLALRRITRLSLTVSGIHQGIECQSKCPTKCPISRNVMVVFMRMSNGGKAFRTWSHVTNATNLHVHLRKHRPNRHLLRSSLKFGFRFSDVRGWVRWVDGAPGVLCSARA